jgi:hypothetical protein
MTTLLRMERLPSYIEAIFALTTFLTVFLFYKAANKSNITLITVVVWLVIQTLVSLTGFYTDTSTVPPRFLLLVGPPLVCILLLFLTPKGKLFLDRLNLSWLTLLHVIRIPVELVLLWLFVHKTVPELMTFEGRNFDIISGLTAPLVYYFCFIKKQWNKNILIAWNVLCLGLLLNIVVNAILSAPTPFQQFAFDQPNIAVLYFPFTWLPCCIVPLVLLSHIASLRQLLQKKVL